ncbi:MAG TPA: c-type cytochrome [Ferruginibacter sp.]|nr:c-type cytochrome [Ferruginibacter sp.]
MSNKVIKYYGIILTLFLAIGGVIFYKVLPDPVRSVDLKEDPRDWYPPGISSLINSPEAGLILYGKELIIETSKYLGPKGIVTSMSNGMNCGSCHLDGGTRIYGNSFAAVAANYPKFRNRSGMMETIEFRINECFERSLNGKKLDSGSREMRAMVAYLKWLGKDVPKKIVPKGSGVPHIEILQRAANVNNGQSIYINKCQSCHGVNGQGQLNPDSTGYTYPPIWGQGSYNVSAGLYRLSSFAGFVKYNMPFTAMRTEPQLTDEEAWDVAAFVNSRERPVKLFKQDWPKIETKPFDHPFGPYADSFSVTRHKYGPWNFVKKKKQGT